MDLMVSLRASILAPSFSMAKRVRVMAAPAARAARARTTSPRVWGLHWSWVGRLSYLRLNWQKQHQTKASP